MTSNFRKKPILFGIAAGAILIIFYFLILSLANSFSHAISQFKEMWYWVLLLAFGFGVQVVLYSHIRCQTKQIKIKGATGEIIAAGSVSTGSMIACCSHHLVDVLPILGLSALFLFLAKYQLFFIFLGIATNIAGIIIMLEIIKKNSLAKECPILNRIVKLNLKLLKNWLIGIFIILLLFSFFFIKNQDFLPNTAKNSGNKNQNPPILSLLPKTNEEAGLSITVTPIDFSFEKPVQFEVSLDTHQGDLDFDLTKKAVLIDDKNNQLLPKEWQGGQGGHHLSGILVFSPLLLETKTMKLKIFDIYGVKEREFSWELR